MDYPTNEKHEIKCPTNINNFTVKIFLYVHMAQNATDRKGSAFSKSQRDSKQTDKSLVSFQTSIQTTHWNETKMGKVQN